MSKPINVVVAVLFKKKVREFFFGPKNQCPKILRPKSVGPKKNWVKENRPKEFKSKKNVVQKIKVQKTI